MLDRLRAPGWLHAQLLPRRRVAHDGHQALISLMNPLDPNSPALSEVETPALVIDGALLDANIERMQVAARRAGVSLRPHAKTHKSPDIARRQRQAGAAGIACATILEAEDMIAAGISDVLITSPVVDAGKVRRLVELHRRSTIMLVVDHPLQVDAISASLAADDVPLALLVDVDVGQARTGVASMAAGLALAKHIQAAPRLRFAGLQGYAGHVQHIVDAENRQQAAHGAAALLGTLADRLRAEGLAPFIVSGSGTGASASDLDGECYTELQPGSYVFMDADYARLRERNGMPLPYDNALFVLATVISVNRAGQVTVDAGTKALAVNGPLPDRIVGAPSGSRYTFAGDEHGTITLPPAAANPRLGSHVLIGTTHCDPTVNLHNGYHVVKGDGTLMHWPIIGRYRTNRR
jgi:D-serine deaminase-like pyridoxal phosphate-dependent protein